MTRSLPAALAVASCVWSAAAQEPRASQDSSPAAGGVDWAQARMNDVLTGWTDLDEMAVAANRQSASFARASRSWAGQLANASSKASPDALRTAQVLARQHADKADRLSRLSRGLRSNPGAGRVGTFLGRWGTPVAALSGAAGAASGGDAVGASQELLNGAGSIKATGLGAAAGLYLGGPFGAVLGGLAGNIVYSQTAGRAVNAAGDKAAALGGPDALDIWGQARTRIDSWASQADELTAASRSLLSQGAPDALERRLPILEAKLSAVGAKLDLWTEHRLQLCSAEAPQTDGLVAGFHAALDGARGDFKQARQFETASCRALARLQLNSDEASKLWGEYSASPGSKRPSAGSTQASLDEAAGLLEQILQADQQLEQLNLRAESIATKLGDVSSEATRLVLEARQAADELYEAESRIAKAEALAGEARSLLQRADAAAARHAFGRHPETSPAAHAVLDSLTRRYGALPTARDFSTARERFSGIRATLGFVLDEASQLESTALTAMQASLDCAPQLIDTPYLARELEAAREEMSRTDMVVRTGDRCHADAQRLATGTRGNQSGGWDLSGATQTVSGPTGAAPTAPRGPDVDGLIQNVAGSVRACDYGSALRAAEAVRSAAPDHPWVAANSSSIGELQPLAGLNLGQTLARAEAHLAAGDDAGWAQAIAPFIQAGCQAPGLQQHLARAQSQADGRGAERERVMAQEVGAGHARAQRNAATFRAATGALLSTAASMSAARSSASPSTASSGGPTASGLPTAVGGVTGSRPTGPGGTTASSSPKPGKFDRCFAMDRGTMEDAEYAVIEWVPNIQYDLVPYRKDLGFDLPGPQGRIVGRYATHGAGLAVLDRLCPLSRRTTMDEIQRLR